MKSEKQDKANLDGAGVKSSSNVKPSPAPETMRLVKFEKCLNGFHWLYEKGENTLSIILHDGSYGHENGLFETQFSLDVMKSRPDGISGHLSFGDVQRKINRLRRSDSP